MPQTIPGWRSFRGPDGSIWYRNNKTGQIQKTVPRVPPPPRQPQPPLSTNSDGSGSQRRPGMSTRERDRRRRERIRARYGVDMSDSDNDSNNLWLGRRLNIGEEDPASDVESMYSFDTARDVGGEPSTQGSFRSNSYGQGSNDSFDSNNQMRIGDYYRADRMVQQRRRSMQDVEEDEEIYGGGASHRGEYERMRGISRGPDVNEHVGRAAPEFSSRGTQTVNYYGNERDGRYSYGTRYDVGQYQRRGEHTHRRDFQLTDDIRNDTRTAQTETSSYQSTVPSEVSFAIQQAIPSPHVPALGLRTDQQREIATHVQNPPMVDTPSETVAQPAEQTSSSQSYVPPLIPRSHDNEHHSTSTSADNASYEHPVDNTSPSGYKHTIAPENEIIPIQVEPPFHSKPTVSSAPSAETHVDQHHVSASAITIDEGEEHSPLLNLTSTIVIQTENRKAETAQSSSSQTYVQSPANAQSHVNQNYTPALSKVTEDSQGDSISQLDETSINAVKSDKNQLAAEPLSSSQSHVRSLSNCEGLHEQRETYVSVSTPVSDNMLHERPAEIVLCPDYMPKNATPKEFVLLPKEEPYSTQSNLPSPPNATSEIVQRLSHAKPSATPHVQEVKQLPLHHIPSDAMQIDNEAVKTEQLSSLVTSVRPSPSSDDPGDGLPKASVSWQGLVSDPVSQKRLQGTVPLLNHTPTDASVCEIETVRVKQSSSSETSGTSRQSIGSHDDHHQLTVQAGAPCKDSAESKRLNRALWLSITGVGAVGLSIFIIRGLISKKGRL